VCTLLEVAGEGVTDLGGGPVADLLGFGHGGLRVKLSESDEMVRCGSSHTCSR
jgi:hypothetical protein